MEQTKQLEIDDYKLEELRIDRNAGFKEGSTDSGPINPSVDFQVFMDAAQANRFAVGLIVKTCGDGPDTQCPLRVVLRIVGFFTVPAALPNGEVPFQIAVNGLTILYGITREIFRAASSLFGTPIHLSTVYFSERMRAKLESAPSEQKAIAPAETVVAVAGLEAPK
jgi:hypothetical protein